MKKIYVLQKEYITISGLMKETSCILAVGFNYHKAPIKLREKLHVPQAQWPQAIGELCSLDHVQEAAVLSTCNRVEIYVVALSMHHGIKQVTEWISKVATIAIFFLLGIYCP